MNLNTTTIVNGVTVTQTSTGVQATNSAGEKIFAFNYNTAKNTFVFSSPTSTETISRSAFTNLKPGDTLSLGKAGSLYVIDNRTIRDSKGNTYTITGNGTTHAAMQEYNANGVLIRQAALPQLSGARGGSNMTIDMTSACAWAIGDVALAVAGGIAASETGVGFFLGMAAAVSAGAHYAAECQR